MWLYSSVLADNVSKLHIFFCKLMISGVTLISSLSFTDLDQLGKSAFFLLSLALINAKISLHEQMASNLKFRISFYHLFEQIYEVALLKRKM